MNDQVIIALAKKFANESKLSPSEVKQGIEDYLDENPEALDQAAVEAIAGQVLDNIVLIQNQQPTSDKNKLWILSDTVQETDVPTYQEFTDLNNDVDGLRSAIADMNTATSTAIGKALSPKTVANGKVTEWQFKTIPSGGGGGGGAVDDVQIDGVSVVQDGVANVPIASSSAYGVVRAGTVSVSGMTPSITALPGIQYICGEVATLDITLPASGCVDVVFESGSTATVLNTTLLTGGTVKWANGFNPNALDANTTYEINVKNGLGVAAAWT